MKNLQEEIRQAKLRLPLLQLMQRLGFQAHAKKSALCPFHEDQRESFSVFQDKGGKSFWKCHAGCGAGDEITFIEKAKGLSRSEACKEFIRLAGFIPCAHVLKVETKLRQLSLPEMWTGGIRDWQQLAALRGVSVEAVKMTVERGLLWFGKVCGIESWLIADKERINVQGRRMDGEEYPAYGELAARKAHTIKGSKQTWPIGILESQSSQFIALVEGGGDLLAAFHFAWCESREDEIAPVAMLGASNSIPVEVLPFFKKKRVRIFPHLDEAGQKAAQRWTSQLEEIGVIVDCFDFRNILRIDGKPVKDLNDLALLNADGFENDPELAEVMP